MGTPPSGVFEKYASVYDLLYREKEYAREVDYIEALCRRFGSKLSNCSILDLGCGTGGHAIPLAKKGYQVVGIDRSATMLHEAQAKAEAEGVSNRLELREGDIQNFELGKKFPIIVCMFAVLGYQTTNQAVLDTLKTVKKHLEAGGLFIFDFWFGPAVLSEGASDRVKTAEQGELKVIRTTHTSLDLHRHVASVHFDLYEIHTTKPLRRYQETHHMRFFFEPELELFLTQTGFRSVHLLPFGKERGDVGADTWNVTAIAQG